MGLSFDDHATVERFRSFLQIPSISLEGPTNGAYRKAVEFLKGLCQIEGLECSEYEYVQNKPILLVTWKGTNPELPSILLNSHYDVVPAEMDKWNEDPFAAVVRPDGNIMARGTQDMKSVCMQYIEAVIRLKRRNVRCARTIHMTFVPDEEIGGLDGMGLFVQNDVAKLNVGVSLDEGLAHEGEGDDKERYSVFYGERSILQLRVSAKGPAGHGSRFIKDAAMEKLIKAINEFLLYRKQQEHDLEHGCHHGVAKKLRLGDVVTVNLTALKGGVTNDGGKTFSLNVIPTYAEAGFDIRIPPALPLKEFEETYLKKWCTENDVNYEFVQRADSSEVSDTNPEVHTSLTAKLWQRHPILCEL